MSLEYFQEAVMLFANVDVCPCDHRLVPLRYVQHGCKKYVGILNDTLMIHMCSYLFSTLPGIENGTHS